MFRRTVKNPLGGIVKGFCIPLDNATVKTTFRAAFPKLDEGLAPGVPLRRDNARPQPVAWLRTSQRSMVAGPTKPR
jgi:hypothetical protein